MSTKGPFPHTDQSAGVGNAGDMEDHYVGSSQGTGAGHEDFGSRMEHPFHDTPPNDESGEGQKPSTQTMKRPM